MKYFISILVLLISCSSENFRNAEDALDAAREYKDGCLKGNFQKAAFYMIDSKNNIDRLNTIKTNYNNKGSQEKRDLKEASIMIKLNKIISPDLSEIVLANSAERNYDTLKVVLQNGKWLVDNIQFHK